MQDHPSLLIPPIFLHYSNTVLKNFLYKNNVYNYEKAVFTTSIALHLSVWITWFLLTKVGQLSDLVQCTLYNVHFLLTYLKNKCKLLSLFHEQQNRRSRNLNKAEDI